MVARQQAALHTPSMVASAATLALLDDLNTPSAVSELSAPLKAANDLLTTKAGKKADDRLLQVRGGDKGDCAAVNPMSIIVG